MKYIVCLFYGTLQLVLNKEKIRLQLASNEEGHLLHYTAYYRVELSVKSAKNPTAHVPIVVPIAIPFKEIVPF